MEKSAREEAVKRLFESGLTTKEIQYVLNWIHGEIISERHVKRILKSMNLGRRKNYCDIDTAVDYICHLLLNTSSECHGYRWMHKKCQQKGYNIKQKIVALIMANIDPEGVALRRANRLIRRNYVSVGPSYLWHIDGYDKIKPYGIAIHGCIDGYSRYIVWLHAYSTNNDPKVIGGYYINAVKNIQGCPIRIRSDFGTENVLVKDIHSSFRNNAERCFLYGSSTMNQRIEAWWSMLRKEGLQFWIKLFRQLKEDGEFSGTWLDKNLIRYCFMELIQVSM